MSDDPVTDKPVSDDPVNDVEISMSLLVQAATANDFLFQAAGCVIWYEVGRRVDEQAVTGVVLMFWVVLGARVQEWLTKRRIRGLLRRQLRPVSKAAP